MNTNTQQDCEKNGCDTGVEKNRTKISFLVIVYNEEARIDNVIKQALCWADEVIVIDKSSTDKTGDICNFYGDKIKHVIVPYAQQGQDDLKPMLAASANDWIFFSTASEMPTHRLVESCKSLLNKQGEGLDLVYVPRKRYMYGIHTPYGKLADVTNYPFLIHRGRAQVQNKIHANFSTKDKSRAGRIEYDEDCCVHHLSYPTVASFMNSHLQYMRVDAEQTPDDLVDAVIQRTFTQGNDLLRELCENRNAEGSVGEAWLGHYCTLLIQRFGICLHLWERRRGSNVKQYYQDLSAAILKKEWNVGPLADADYPRLTVAHVTNPSITERTKINKWLRKHLPSKLRHSIRKRLNAVVAWFN
ncbi:MAG: glycosyltransferase [Verrucomicrobia bacterium]|nr:glycosyltransferase [Verrucomicrobiota bacterium]